MIAVTINEYHIAVNLPNSINNAAVAQYLRSFVIVGGWNSATRLDTVIRYAEEGTWETLPTHLTDPRLSHVAIAISPTC